MDASQTMLDQVRHTREEAERAERGYDIAADRIQMMSERSIDLFGGDVTSRVMEIASETRNASEELYSTYQTLVQMLDAQLRPLLDQGPSIHAVKEVYECIRHLNSESNISTNFSGSLNGSSFGEFASIRLSPTIECRMIEKFWEQAYHVMPGWEEEDRAFRERQAAERKARVEAEMAAREAQRQFEREERERERREKEQTEARRVREEAELQGRLALMRTVAQWASRRVAVELGGFCKSFVAVDKDGHLLVQSEVDEAAQAVARGWRNIEKVPVNGELIYGLDHDGTVHVAGKGTMHNESACAGWSGLKDLVLGDYVSIGLTKDGRVLATGESRFAHPNSTAPAPFTWTDIDEVWCGGSNEIVGRKLDGSLISVSYNYYTHSDAGPWTPDGGVVMAAMSSNGFGAYLQDDGRVSTFGHNVISGDSLAGKAGIIHIAMLGNHTLAVYHDGTVRVSQRIDNDVYVNKVRQFLRRHSLDGRVLCACGNADHVAFVTTDGEVYQMMRSSSSKVHEGKVEGLHLFESLGEAIDRAQNPEKYRQMAREAEARLVAERRAAGVCAACGAPFRKMLFFSVCTACGRRKDY